jgi:hypothetical protein
MERELQLNALQQKEIETILAASRERMRRLWEGFSPQAEAESARMRQQVEAILTPEQQAKFRELMARGPRRPEGWKKEGSTEHSPARGSSRTRPSSSPPREERQGSP